MATLAIEVLNLRKTFGSNGTAVHAVDGVEFAVRGGEIFSLLGPNGAGKTTTISMLSCLLRPTGGDARILGRSITSDSMGVRSVLGVVPQDIALYEDMTARENLMFWGQMQDLTGAQLKKRVDEVLEVIGLSDRQNERVSKYSGGMKRRVNIGAALLHKPQVIYMDEPTVGIDPQSRRSILDSVVALKQQGITVLYTTHYMEEAEELSDHIGIMDHGKVVACGTHAELVRAVGEVDRIRLVVNSEDAPAELWKPAPGVRQVTTDGGEVTLLVDDANRALPRLFEIAAANALRVTSVEIKEPNLEAVFLHYTGRALRD